MKFVLQNRLKNLNMELILAITLFCLFLTSIYLLIKVHKLGATCIRNPNLTKENIDINYNETKWK